MKEEDIRNRKTLDTYLELVQKDCQKYFKNKEDYTEIDCCACGGNKHLFQFSKNDFKYVTCLNCDTLYVLNRPPSNMLKSFYSESESSSYWTNNFFKPVMEARREKIFYPRAQSVAEYFGNNKNWIIADVGAGFGIFLDELRKLWPDGQYIAIEPSLEQADICKNSGFMVECCFVEELQGYDNTFNLITSFELFEHLNDPIRYVEKVYQLLKPGGYFFMTTLNGHGFDIQILWEKSKSVTPPHHLNFFNPDSLSRLFEIHGFKIEDLSTPGKLDWDIVEGMINNENVDAGRFWRLLAKKGTAEAKNDIQKWISENRFSSHMKILARKPE